MFYCLRSIVPIENCSWALGHGNRSYRNELETGDRENARVAQKKVGKHERGGTEDTYGDFCGFCGSVGGVEMDGLKKKGRRCDGEEERSNERRDGRWTYMYADSLGKG